MIRPATEEDAPAIARVEAAAAKGPWAEASVRGSLRTPTTRAWVAADPHVIGHVLSAWVAEEAEILTIAVDPVAQRRGWAGRLLAACEEAWRSEGVTVAWLEVRVDNVPAKALYASHGWTEAGVRRRYYADGTDAQVLRWSC